MSQNVSIMFLFIGAFIAALGLIDAYKKEKGFTLKKTIYILAFISFLSVGTWDTCNRYKDSFKDHSEVINKISKGDSTLGKKSDSGTDLLHKGIDVNNSLIKSLPKKQAATISQINKDGKNEVTQNSGINNGMIGGTGNTKEEHIVNGINNGINGNVNVNTERELQESDKLPLINFIEKIKKDNGSNTTCIELFSSNSTNSQKMLPQLRAFLSKVGYMVKEGYGYKLFTSPISGIDISYKDNCVQITVGAL